MGSGARFVSRWPGAASKDVALRGPSTIYTKDTFHNSPLFHNPRVPNQKKPRGQQNKRSTTKHRLQQLQFHQLPQRNQYTHRTKQRFITLLSHKQQQLRRNHHNLPQRIHSQGKATNHCHTLQQGLQRTSPRRQFRQHRIIYHNFITLYKQGKLYIQLSKVQKLHHLLYFQHSPRRSQGKTSQDQSQWICDLQHLHRNVSRGSCQTTRRITRRPYNVHIIHIRKRKHNNSRDLRNQVCQLQRIPRNIHIQHSCSYRRPYLCQPTRIWTLPRIHRQIPSKHSPTNQRKATTRNTRSSNNSHYTRNNTNH